MDLLDFLRELQLETCIEDVTFGDYVLQLHISKEGCLSAELVNNCCNDCPCPNEYTFEDVIIGATTQRYICDEGVYSRITGTLEFNGNPGNFVVFVNAAGDIVQSPTTATFEPGNYIQFGTVSLVILDGTLIGNTLTVTVCGNIQEFLDNNPFQLLLTTTECYTSDAILTVDVVLTHIATGATFSGTTNSGQFFFNGPVGLYNVTASAVGYITNNFTIEYETDDLSENICLIQLNDKVIHVRNCGYNLPVVGATVTATHIETGVIYSGITDANGDFLFANAPDGDYHIVVTSLYPTYDTVATISNNTTAQVIYNVTLCPAQPATIRFSGCDAYGAPSTQFAAHWVSGPTNFGTVLVENFFSAITLNQLLPGTYTIDIYSPLYPLTPTLTYIITVVAGQFFNATPGTGYPCPEFDQYGSFYIFCDDYTVANGTLTYVSGPTFIPTIGPQSFGFIIYNGSGTQPAFGTYQFTLAAPGYQSQTVTVDYVYTGGDSVYEICLIPTTDPGGMTIGCDNFGGSGINYTVTYVSGPTAFAPVTADAGAGVDITPIAGGIYMVLVQAPGYQDETIQVVIPGGTTTIITDLCLEPEPDPGISGCTNASADNYNPLATVDDGSCTFSPPPGGLGCTDSAATNYNPLATIDDGSCTYPEI